MDFSSLAGKVVLVENVASLWGTTVRDFTQMNELCEKYGDKLVRIFAIELWINVSFYVFRKSRTFVCFNLIYKQISFFNIVLIT